MSLRAGAILVLLLAVNGFWFASESEHRAESAALSARRDELARTLNVVEAGAPAARSLALLGKLSRSLGDEDSASFPTSISEWRKRLVSAERGLGLRREVLEFREDGSEEISIRVSLQGTFADIWVYAQRLEAMRLPLALRELNMNGDGGERVSLSTAWSARFPGEAMELSQLVSSADRLEAWFERAPSASPERNPFGTVSERESGPIAADSPAPSVPISTEVEAEAPPRAERPPRLTGFISSESAGKPRLRAAIAFDGAIQILSEGEAWGGFELVEIKRRHSVILVETRTGERLELRLDP